VALGGESWLAITDARAPLAVNIQVIVISVQGTTLLVRPPEDSRR
jgi:membrane protein implicated in regulation of membrane protease activity